MAYPYKYIIMQSRHLVDTRVYRAMTEIFRYKTYGYYARNTPDHSVYNM